MVKIYLLTSKNDLIIPALRNEGLAAEELPAGSDIYYITENSYMLMEISGPDSAEKIETIVKSQHETSGIVCFCESLTADIRYFLLKNGLADCLETTDPVQISEYFSTVIKPYGRKGKFLILDDNVIHRRILASVIKRFGFETNFITGIDELFEMAGDPENIMVLINMGTAKLDMNAVVRRSYNNPDIKKNPVVAYKSMKQGLFVHEIINGLNRLTKIILSPEELYFMLTDLLFKKEIMSYTDSFTDFLKYDRFFSYAGKNIQQIYYEIQANPCGQDSFFDPGCMKSLIQSSGKIRDSLKRVQGITWLACHGFTGKNLTCGGGV